jgi:hypothetical protein
MRSEAERTPLWVACYHGNIAAMQAGAYTRPLFYST